MEVSQGVPGIAQQGKKKKKRSIYRSLHHSLKMLGYLEKLQERVLYTGTYSFIYIVRGDGEAPLEMGAYLGELTDELGVDSIQTQAGKIVLQGSQRLAHAVCWSTLTANDFHLKNS